MYAVERMRLYRELAMRTQDSLRFWMEMGDSTRVQETEARLTGLRQLVSYYQGERDLIDPIKNSEERADAQVEYHKQFWPG